MRFWKKRLQCTVALVCMLAMITSLLPTAAFAQEVIPTDSTVQADPNGPATEPTTTPADAEPTPETATPTPESTAEPTPEAATPTPETTAEPAPSEEPAEVTPAPAQQPVMKAPAAPANANGNDAAPNGARAPKVAGTNATAKSEDEIFTVDYYAGATGASLMTNLTVIMQDEDGNEIDRTAVIEDAYRGGSTMEITLNDAYLQYYELKKVWSDDATISDWSEDFNDAGETVFTWNAISEDTATIYVTVAEQSHLLELANDDGSVDLGSILWKEGGNQLTKVEAYLNYELVYESDYMHISNSLNNFDLTVNDGYYFDTESMQNIRWESDVPGQTFTLTPVGDYNKLTFGVAPSLPHTVDGKNTVKLYFFTYDEDSGLKVDFNRFIDYNSAHPDLDAACPALDISFTHNGVGYAFVHDTFSSSNTSGLQSYNVFLPYDTNITVKPQIQSGYQFICWLSDDNWVEGNNLYSIQSNGNWIQETTGAAGLQKGRIAFTETMGMRYDKESAFQNGLVNLRMTTDGSTWPEADAITYHPNYEGATEKPVVQYVWNRYGTLIKENMFTREGYTFVEWNTKPDGSGVAYDPYDPYENHTNMDLYAQWKEDTQPEPEIPDPADSIDDLTGAVNVICSTNAHTQAAYGVLGTKNTDWTLSWTEGAETATITVKYAPYVTKYNQDNPSVEHIYDSSNTGNDLTVELKYENDAWTVDDAADVYVQDKEDENPDAKLTKTLDKVERDGAEISFAQGDMLKVGDALTYTITVENTGNTELTGLIVTDTFGGAGDPVFPTDKTPTENPDGTYTWTIQSLAAGDTWTVTYTYTVVDEDADAESLVNDASVTGGDLDDDEDGTETDVENPDAKLTKELTAINRNGEDVTVDDATALKVGDEITYEITVENTGNVALEDLTVTDTFDGAGELEFPADQTPTENPDGTYTWTIEDLAVDGTWTVTCTYTVVQADAGDTLKNAAAVEGGELDEPGTDPDDPTPPEDEDERDVTDDDDDDDQKPGDDDDQKPGDDDDQKPGGDDGQKPGGDDDQKPGGDDSQKPGDDSQKPGGDGQKPGGDDGQKPGDDGDGKDNGDDGNGKDNGDDAKIPPTGDNTPVTLLFTLTLAAAGGLTTVLVLRKRRDGKA